MQNSVIKKNGLKWPGNDYMGAFGCDSYDISGTVDRRGSNGALHGLTKFNMDNVPSNHFFLEYISRPQTAEIFFEDVLMACVFYGMPILAENNKSYIEHHVGLKDDGNYGDVYFQRTLEDWAKFNINNRTSHDASISSGLAIMACNKNKYKPNPTFKRPSYNLGFKRYNNKGTLSKIIE
jgi:hypothetical protein